MVNENSLKLPSDIYVIRKSVFVAAPINKVFEVVTDSKHLDRYFTTGMELDPRVGGACNFKWEDRGPDLISLESPGRVIEIDPPRRFVFEWGRPGERTIAALSLETRRNGTVLSVLEDGYPQTEDGLRSILECSAHWGELLALIKFYVEYGVTYRSHVDRAA